jgi:hypothetical protein
MATEIRHPDIKELTLLSISTSNATGVRVQRERSRADHPVSRPRPPNFFIHNFRLSGSTFSKACHNRHHLPFSNMSKAASARAKFAELRALRESGKKRLDTYQVHQEADLYEEVDEDGYKKVVRDRLNQDDFVIDDNGEGYADDGREEWDRQPDYGSESEELPTKGKSGKAGEWNDISTPIAYHG